MLIQSMAKEAWMTLFSRRRVPLLDSAGDNYASDVCSLWHGTVSLKGRQYILLDGGVCTRLVHMLSEVIEQCNEDRKCSEWEFVFPPLILQWDKMVRKGRIFVCFSRGKWHVGSWETEQVAPGSSTLWQSIDLRMGTVLMIVNKLPYWKELYSYLG